MVIIRVNCESTAPPQQPQKRATIFLGRPVYAPVEGNLCLSSKEVSELH